MIRRHPVVLGLALLVLGVGLLLHHGVAAVITAAVATYVILLLGVVMLGGLARPRPEPPPAWELRRVRLVYRCTTCGTEVRMTAANDEDPEPPRHCADDMELVTPVE